MFVSNLALHDRKTQPRARHRWALDSGGFSEISRFGHWRTTRHEYISNVQRYVDEIGNLDWAAIQDWMCEPFILDITGLTIERHQELTIQSYLDLMHDASDLPWVPVIQGWQADDYLRHIEMYERAGVNLESLELVGVGSVCRRQRMPEAAAIFEAIANLGIKTHGFGIKKTGLKMFKDDLASADSMAWSFRARRSAPLPGHTHSACQNCIDYATIWREEIVRVIQGEQMVMPL